MSLITQLKILKLSKIKPNFSKLAREYEIDRRTVKKYYDGYEGKPAHRNKASKLDKHKQLIAQKLQIKGANVKAVYEFIVDEIDENIGTYSNFNKYVVANNLLPKTAAKGHPRYETAPGIQAQVDWKEDIKIANCYGEIFTFQVFDYKLGYVNLVNNGEKSFTQALEELVEIEKKENQKRRDLANVKVANFPFLKTFDDYEFDFQPNVNKKELLELNSLGFVDKHENVVFVGSSGVGKTHLATSLGITCAKARYQTYFITFENLITQLKKAIQENRLENRLKFYAKYRVLIIDEIGYMPIDQDTANVFFQLIAKRYEKNSTIVTTNMPFSKWGEFFGSATLANAVLDRLLHHSTVISIKGPSYRLKDKKLLFESNSKEG